jgi:hypothetical protein
LFNAAQDRSPSSRCSEALIAPVLAANRRNNFESSAQVGDNSRRAGVDFGGLRTEFQHPRRELGLDIVVLPGHPFYVAAHGACVCTTGGCRLAFRQHRDVHIAGGNLYNQRPAPDGLTSRQIFASGQD